MNYKSLVDELFKIKDEKYAIFSKSLSNSDYISIGVKTPFLKDIIKKYKNDTDLKLEDFVLGEYLEVDYLYFCLSLSRLKTVDDQFDFIINNIKKAKSWCITDSLSCFLKKHDYDKYRSFFLKLQGSNYTYDRRTAYVVGLKHYRNKDILEVLDYIKPNEEYMVMMSEAWLLATITIAYPQEVYDYLKNNADTTLKRKTISKIVESYRIDDLNKNKFKSLRNQ